MYKLTELGVDRGFLAKADEFGGSPEFHNGEYVGFTGIDHEHDCNK